MLIELKGIKKYFSVKHGAFGGRRVDVVRAVDGVDLSIKPGESLGLVGESGCGKTTLGRIIMRLIEPDAGRIVFEGTDLTRFSAKKMRPYRKNIQMVFQDPFNSLDPRFSIRRILREAMIYDHVKDKSRQEKQMAEALTAVGLNPGSLSRFPHEFSGGERQRIAIARSLIMNPKLLILDEAVSSLDVLIQEQLINLLKDLQEKFQLTYLFISHNLRVVQKVCRNIAVMYKGKIVELAPGQEIFENPLHPYTKELLSAAINYKSSGYSPDASLIKEGHLVDKGEGHFVAE